MAENSVDATLEENKKLREQIEAIQRKRRRNFADADRIHEETLARKENERLKSVLASQEDLLAAAETAKDAAGKSTTEEAARANQVPYTVTKDGPVYSTPNRGKAEEKPASGSGARSATPPSVPRSTYGLPENSADKSDDKNEEN